MDDGEVDSPSSGGGLFDLQPDFYSHLLDDNFSIQNELETMSGRQICSHKHICNPTTGPDNTHTHTCEHTHTHISSGDDEKLTKKRRPSGNKEAVRKYREKQKAVKVNLEVRNAELEKENQIIPELQKENLMLRRKLQEQSPRQDAFQILVTENKRLKALLAQFRRSIDSELEGVAYPKMVFAAPPKVDRVYHSSVARCAAPVPCFPARPVSHHSTGDLGEDVMEEGSLGWHSECEMVGNTVMVCHSPRELEEAHVGTDQCATSGADLTTTPTKPRVQSIVRSSKGGGAVARKHDNGPLIPPVSAAPAAYQQQPRMVSCAAAAPPVQCLDKSSGPAASPLLRQPQQHNCIERWQDGCDLSCGDVEMTADSSPHSDSLSPPVEALQSAGTPMLKPAVVTTPLNKSPVGTTTTAFGGQFYNNDVLPGTEACWNNGWLECDIVDGVCQAHVLNAAQDSAFRPAADPSGQSSRPSAAVLS